ncbi:MAG: YtxH domain-containing protein [Pseudomonadota bacterium]
MNNTESFILGGLVGAVAALLLTPRTGAENRHELRRALEKGRERLGDAEAVAQIRVMALVDEIQEKTGKLLAAGGEMAEAKRQDLMEAIQVAKRALAEEREILMRSHRERRAAIEEAANEE